jgi:CrcB protein
MKYLVFVALGGAGGAVARYLLANVVHSWTNHHIPFGTMAVNVLGSFLIGILYVLIVEKMLIHEDWRGVLMVGFLGAFTTFSTFSLESLALMENGHVGSALLYILGSVTLCILAVWCAAVLTRLI